MNEPETKNPDDGSQRAGMEQLLGRFAPRPSRIDRDRLMYLAGEAAAATSRSPLATRTSPAWYWPTSTAVSTLVAIVLVVVLVHDRVTRTPAAPTSVPVVVDSSPRPSADSTDHVRRTDATPATVDLAPGGVFHADELAQVSAVNLLRLREAALRSGVDALPTAQSVGANPSLLTTYGQGLGGSSRPDGLRRRLSFEN